MSDLLRPFLNFIHYLRGSTTITATLINNDEGHYQISVCCTAGSVNFQISDDGSNWETTVPLATGENEFMQVIYIPHSARVNISSGTARYYISKIT